MSRERDDESQSLLRLGLGYQMNFINRYNPSEQALVADILLQLGVQYIQEHSNNPTPSVDQLQLMLTGNQSSESLLGQLKSQVNQLTQQVNSVLEQQHQSQSNAASLSNIGCQTASNQQQQKTAATSTLPTASTGQATMLQRLLDMQQRPHVRPAGMHKRHQQLSYGAYPAWWGHQESASKRPQRKSKTSNNNGKKQQPVTADPWTGKITILVLYYLNLYDSPEKDYR